MKMMLMRMTAAALALAAAAFSGCGTTPWVRGSIARGMPRHSGGFPADAAFHVEKTERRVRKAFECAVRERGFTVAEKPEDSDFVVRPTVDAWEYNDIGFGGRTGPRDHMELSVSLIDRRKKRIVERSRISLRSDFRIIGKYFNELFNEL